MAGHYHFALLFFIKTVRLFHGHGPLFELEGDGRDGQMRASEQNHMASI
jgi:hypothetical protein